LVGVDSPAFKPDGSSKESPRLLYGILIIISLILFGVLIWLFFSDTFSEDFAGASGKQEGWFSYRSN